MTPMYPQRRAGAGGGAWSRIFRRRAPRGVAPGHGGGRQDAETQGGEAGGGLREGEGDLPGRDRGDEAAQPPAPRQDARHLRREVALLPRPGTVPKRGPQTLSQVFRFHQGGLF